MSTGHELTDEAKHRLKELETLSQMAEDGDKQARRKLRRAQYVNLPRRW